jgi:hypothetical protein
MSRGFVRTALLLVLLSVAAAPASAQDRIAPGYLDLGLMVGGGEIDDANIAWGVRVEKLVRTLPSLGNGVLGVQVGINAHSYPFGLGHYWVFFPVGVSANYHFTPGNGSFDPFVALGGGYKFAHCDRYKVTWADCSGESGEAFGIARVGAKFFTSERVGISVDAGLGASLASVGLVFRLK